MLQLVSFLQKLDFQLFALLSVVWDSQLIQRYAICKVHLIFKWALVMKAHVHFKISHACKITHYIIPIHTILTKMCVIQNALILLQTRKPFSATEISAPVRICKRADIENIESHPHNLLPLLNLMVLVCVCLGGLERENHLAALRSGFERGLRIRLVLGDLSPL